MKTLSDLVVKILLDAGVTHAYGVPGDAIDLILDAIHRNENFDFYLTRHEEGAGFMANGYAKLTGKLGVVLVSQGPGTAHMLDAMYDAKMDKVPLLVISGQIESGLIGTNSVQEINQLLLFEDVACFNREVRSANNLVDILQLAIQTALTRRNVAHVSIATDILRQPIVKYSPNTSIFNLHYNQLPTTMALQQAADILNRHELVSILYGGGCLNAAAEVIKIAELLKAPLIHTVRSKDIIDNHHAHYVGGIGFKGSKNGCKYVKDCDALLVIGCSFVWKNFYPTNTPIIQIDLEPERIGVRCHVAVGLVGDAKITLEHLIDKIKPKTKDNFLRAAQAEHIKAINTLNEHAAVHNDAKIIHSAVLTKIISDNLTEDAIVTVDAGTVSVWANNWLRLNGKQRLISSTELGTLGFGMPAAIGCKMAMSERQVVTLCGDGGFQMTMSDFSTAIKYNIPIIVIIYNNFAYHFIALEQMKEGVAQCYTKLNNPNYALLAEAFGGKGFTVTQPNQIESTIKAAFACQAPCIVDVHTDPNELIMPTKLTLSLIGNFLKGEIKTKLSQSDD